MNSREDYSGRKMPAIARVYTFTTGPNFKLDILFPLGEYPAACCENFKLVE